jgi:hypothetical protein
MCVATEIELDRLAYEVSVRRQLRILKQGL